jgi:alanine racemase
MEASNRSWIEIDLTAYRHNYKAMRALLPDGMNILQIVKADAYGHGAVEVARAAVEMGAVMLGVANAEEGSILRYRGLQVPILILSPSLIHEIDLIREYQLTPTVSDIAFARALDSAVAAPFPIHVEIDSGMGRSGVHYRDALPFIRELITCKNLRIDGIFSHYSSAENDQDYSTTQYTRFQATLKELDGLVSPTFRHISNSPAVLTMPTEGTNLVRLGLLSYGVYPAPVLRSQIDVHPVMTFKTRIGQLRQAVRGESIGYNRTFIADTDLRYAVLPVGYADGYDFLLSNRAHVSIHGTLCPVIGKISMDMTAVRIPDQLSVSVDDEVVLLGGNNLGAEDLTELYGGNPYELLCQVGRRARRFYYDQGNLVSSAPLARREFISRDFTDDRLDVVIEAAIGQRLHSKEIASIVSSDILRQFFFDRDREIFYRSAFEHTIRFRDIGDSEAYLVQTELTFCKVLQNDYFLVACANQPEQLNRYFLRRDCEYRWLLDDNFQLSPERFKVTEVRVNDCLLSTESRLRDDCIEIRCSHPELTGLVGSEVVFSIATETYYPRKSHQLSVFVTEITRGVKVAFEYPESVRKVETITVFAGRRRFPELTQQPGCTTITTSPDEWVFPNSGIVFAY